MPYRTLLSLLAVASIAACGEVKDNTQLPDGAPPPPPDAAAADCMRDDSRSQRDTNTNRDWKPLWFCKNVGGAMIYEGPSSGSTPEARMDTTYSWFVCWKRGETHQGDNDVWYYTQGDRKEPGSSHEMWGFMAAYNVMSSVHPIPDMVECP